MKLISLITILATVRSQNVQQEKFSFPPQFQTPSSAFFSSDSSIYLPPESHTAIPYYAFNNNNKLQFQSSPPTGTKIPFIFSTPFPILLSSTLNSNFDDEDNGHDRDEIHNRRFQKSNPYLQNNLNHTSTSRQIFENRDTKINSRTMNFQKPLEHFDGKESNYASGTKAPAARRMIVTSEIQRAEVAPDQLKASSIQNPQYIQAPGIFITSTAEPSIPILRLSNEMDLDGSFSYEALGADQTHYVQHSRMENMGTDNEQQVVEGSYSYVGDDGRTYTVHYVADSNGYRATGDHLPVPPPIPEIIQRAVQYNLAEEAKKPPHLKSSWDNEEHENENREETRHRYFNIPPPRNLFTGKTPEAFSFGFSQGTNSQNNLATASSYQIPTKINFDKIVDQSKSKLNVTPISPQITFLASQGAHNPSLQPQSPPTKINNNEKPPLPLLMNYEADANDHEQDANKGLWRWQYGLNTNTNQTPNKNSISRSSSDGDDVVINFSDMTPDQYTRMIQSQMFGQNVEESNKIDKSVKQPSSTPNVQNIEILNNYDDNKNPQNINIETEKYQTSTEKNDLYLKPNIPSKQSDIEIYSKIISSHNFIPKNQIATQSYNIEFTKQEPTQINEISESSSENFTTAYKVEYENNKYFLPNNYNHEETVSINPDVNSFQNLKISEGIQDENNGFKPVSYKTDNTIFKHDPTTTEPSMKDIIKENIFLRNLFKSDNYEEKPKQQIEEANNLPANVTLELKQDKIPKYYEIQEKPQNEIKIAQSRPLDINDVLNYVVMKNHFESVKTKPKNKPTNNYNINTKVKDTSVHFIPITEKNIERENNKQEQESDYRVLNSQQQKELQGLIKNYKVLQRHKNMAHKSQPMTEPQRHIKAFHTPGLPPLGRAGPSMKSYLPPTYL